MEIEKDKIFEMAERYVNHTGCSVFLTGKAGTGKTTFLRYIARTSRKRFVILAPTDVAVINAGGSTIHSFFQLPLCPCIHYYASKYDVGYRVSDPPHEKGTPLHQRLR